MVGKFLKRLCCIIEFVAVSINIHFLLLKQKSDNRMQITFLKDFYLSI